MVQLSSTRLKPFNVFFSNSAHTYMCIYTQTRTHTQCVTHVCSLLMLAMSMMLSHHERETSKSYRDLASCMCGPGRPAPIMRCLLCYCSRYFASLYKYFKHLKLYDVFVQLHIFQTLCIFRNTSQPLPRPLHSLMEENVRTTICKMAAAIV